jgi:hypothetical protein
MFNKIRAYNFKKICDIPSNYNTYLLVENLSRISDNNVPFINIKTNEYELKFHKTTNKIISIKNNVLTYLNDSGEKVYIKFSLSSAKEHEKALEELNEKTFQENLKKIVEYIPDGTVLPKDVFEELVRKTFQKFKENFQEICEDGYRVSFRHNSYGANLNCFLKNDVIYYKLGESNETPTSKHFKELINNYVVKCLEKFSEDVDYKFFENLREMLKEVP